MALTLEQAVVELERDVEGQLRQAGVKGQTHSCTDCPTAKWLSMMTGEVVEVRFHTIKVQGGSKGIKMPPNIKSFEKRFDRGHHREFRN